MSDLDRQLLGHLYTSNRAYANLRDLCDAAPHRFAGSPGETAAALWLQDRLRDYGLHGVTAEPFAYTGWVRGPEALEVHQPIRHTLRSLALPYCPAAVIEAELAWAGDGEEEDYARAGAADGHLRGKIVMTAAETSGRGDRPSSHRRDKFMRAVQAGAAAYLYVNQNPGDMPITGGLPGGGKGAAPIPGLGLTFETGEQLRRWLERGPVRLSISVAASFPPVDSANVSAEIPADPASPLRGEVVIAGGHYDCHDIAPGALDNGAGVVVTLEAARALAALARETGRGFARRLRFCFFAAEEIGLLGSWEYVRRHQSELDAIAFMLNLDTSGRGAPGTESLAVTSDSSLVPYFQRVTDEMGYPIDVRERFSSASDHFPFAMNGVPTAGIGSTQTSAAVAGLVGRGWGHTPADTFDKANAKSLQAAAMVTARILLHVAQAGDWPVSRRAPEDVEAQLQQAGILEHLKQSGRWPPPR
ncbi:MAG TPA: M20/M25/M40 family metallo-hydrolase [Chloroflexota bacterium]|nr:M20/M25/M40 family metallo-hydrolase [Chloroflexota bacterium]